MTSATCRICRATGEHERFVVREMMFGLRETFEYFRCGACRCLQIAEFPADLARFYPRDYYSLAVSNSDRPRNPLLRALRKARNEHALTGKGRLGGWLASRFPYPELASLSRVPGLSRASRVLDVGCGTGVLIRALADHGFRDPLGLEPFIERELEYPNGARVVRRTLEEAQGQWNVVMFHHSFEHLADPAGALRHAARLMAPGGCCIVRTPVMPSVAWEEFGEHWVSLDAPRHLYIHSVESLKLLATAAGLAMREVVYDSTALQFWGSEQYRQDIPLRSARSYYMDPKSSIFTKSQIQAFRSRATMLNSDRRGDQAAFYLA